LITDQQASLLTFLEVFDKVLTGLLEAIK